MRQEEFVGLVLAYCEGLYVFNPLNVRADKRAQELKK
jgi:hypothetical protein